MKFTIFTPTYNRVDKLGEVYKSILLQGYTDMEWVIMDDGSEDNTKEVVKQWIKDGRVKIKYYYQVNQGRFAAYNNAIPYFGGELVLLVDSDNKLLDNSLRELEKCWERLSYKRDEVSGIIAYMVNEKGRRVGNKFPDNIENEKIYLLYDKYKLSGDKFLAFKNELVKKYKYPVFEGEKFGGDSIVFNKINDEFPMHIFRKNILERGDGSDSITNNLLEYHLKSPNGMREHYKDAIFHERYNKKNIVKHSIGYIGYSIMTKVKPIDIIKYSPYKGLTILLYPLGIIFYFRCKVIKEKNF